MAPQDVQQLLHHAEPVVEQLHAAVDLQVFGHLRLGVDGEDTVGGTLWQLGFRVEVAAEQVHAAVGLHAFGQLVQ